VARATAVRGFLPLGLALVAIAGGAAAAVAAAPAPARRTLRVCADPNNLPFSSERLDGLENALAALVARELGAEVRYAWLPQRRGFVRHTLGAGICDVMMEAPAGYERVLTTRPYYRSTYVFVTRADRGLDLRSLDDPRLAKLRIGVQVVGDDYANTPPAHALGRRGLAANVVGFPVYGDYRAPAPLEPVMKAVSDGTVDVAIVWGPLAGYYLRREGVPLAIAPLPPERDPALRSSFDIAMAVRKGNEKLRDELDAVLVRRRAEIDAILGRFGVPRVDAQGR